MQDYCDFTACCYQNKDRFLEKSAAVVPLRTCYLFTLSHPPLAPLSMTREQMVHSRRRVIESPWRKCNCFSNYVLTATEQWESMRPQLYIEYLEEGSSFLRCDMNSFDHRLGDNWLTAWQQCSLILLFFFWLSGQLSPPREVVNSQVTKTAAQIPCVTLLRLGALRVFGSARCSG